jgi:hypothetical protein
MSRRNVYHLSRCLEKCKWTGHQGAQHSTVEDNVGTNVTCWSAG